MQALLAEHGNTPSVLASKLGPLASDISAVLQKQGKSAGSLAEQLRRLAGASGLHRRSTLEVDNTAVTAEEFTAEYVRHPSALRTCVSPVWELPLKLRSAAWAAQAPASTSVYSTALSACRSARARVP